MEPVTKKAICIARKVSGCFDSTTPSSPRMVRFDESRKPINQHGSDSVHRRSLSATKANCPVCSGRITTANRCRSPGLSGAGMLTDYGYGL